MTTNKIFLKLEKKSINATHYLLIKHKLCLIIFTKKAHFFGDLNCPSPENIFTLQVSHFASLSFFFNKNLKYAYIITFFDIWVIDTGSKKVVFQYRFIRIFEKCKSVIDNNGSILYLQILI